MKLEDQVRDRIRLQGKSKETFKTYWHWCERFIRWLHDDTGRWIHPKDVGKDEELQNKINLLQYKLTGIGVHLSSSISQHGGA